MIRRVPQVTAVLLAGAIVTAALYWGLLNTPDANVAMLGVSALLFAALVAIAALSVTAAVLVANGAAPRTALAAAPRRGGWCLVAFVPLALGWYAIGRADAWIAAHLGEINAWFIARFGWADISGLLLAELWISRWLRWAMLPVMSLSWLAARLSADRSRGTGWLRHAWHWRTLLGATLVVLLLFVIPWRLTEWRPAVPATWIEPAVAAARLAVVFVLAIVGGAVLVVVASFGATTTQVPGVPTVPTVPGVRGASGA